MTDPKDWKQYAMTVGDLKRKLARHSEDLPVIMSKDAEGNGYSPLFGVWPAHYEAASSYNGEIKDDEENYEEDEYDSYAEYLGDAVPVVLLGPVN